MKRKKVWAFILSAVMAFGSFNMAFAAAEPEVTSTNAAQFKDVAKHWAASAINKWSEYGIISGFEGLFRPNDSITRGEIAVILDNMMDYQQVAKNSFTDLKSGKFYTEAILKANAAGIIKGEGKTVRPTDKITREEAAVIIARALAVDASASGTASFSDSASIASWAKGYVKAMEAKGYVKGSNSNFLPKTNITRAEIVTMIDNIVKAYYTKAGTYTENVNGTAVIKVSDVTLKDVTISENLIVAEGVGQGDATLDSVTVKGNTVVRGGGENSVHIVGTSNITSVRIEKTDGKIRVVISDGNTVKEVEVAEGEEIIVAGTVGTLDIAASNATVYATAAEITKANITGENSTVIVDTKSKISTVAVSGTGDNTSIQTQEGAQVGTITAEAGVKVSGKGKVSNVDLKDGADGSSITTPETKTTVDKGVTGVTGGGGKSIAEGTIGTNNNQGNNLVAAAGGSSGGGGGSGGSATVALSAINSITGTAKVGVELTAGSLTPADATVSYQWKICATVDGTYTDIGTNSNKYTPVTDDAGKFIKVAATGTGSYVGTVTSAPTAAVVAATTVSGTAIAGVTPPVTGAMPVTIATATEEYTAAVTWNTTPVTFAAGTSYTATITLTPKAGYTLTGVTVNQFAVTGALTVTNPSNSGVVTAVFPADLTGTGVNVLVGNITGTTTEMEYSLNSTTGFDGAWTDCAAANTPVAFVAGKVYVREKAHPTNTYLVATLSVAGAPTSGVTYSVAAGTVTGLGATYEYSLNGGAWTTTASSVSFIAGDVTVRTKATASTLPSAAQTIGTIAAVAGAPTVSLSNDTSATAVFKKSADGTGVTVATADGYEFSLNGTTWNPILDGTTVDASGNATVTVRVKATAAAFASAATADLDTSNALIDLTGVGVNVLVGNITGTTTEMEYSLNSTTGFDGAWTDCAAANTPVTFVAGKVYVREKAHPTNTYLVTTLSVAGAPTSGVTYSVAAGTVTGLGATYEYNLNGGAWTTIATSVNFVAGAVTVRTKATASTLPSAAQTIGTIAAVAGAPTVSLSNDTSAAAVFKKSADGTGVTVATSDGYEFSLNGTTWNPILDGTTVDASGNATVTVRVKATAAAFASAATADLDTSNALIDLTGVGVNVLVGNITGTTTEMEYSLNSTTGFDGAWTDCAAANTPVTFVAGNVYVREKAHPTNTYLVATLSAVAGAPTVSLSNDTSATAVFKKSADGTGDTVATADGYEFSLNGTTWNPILGGTTVDASGNATITVRVKATAAAFASAATADLDTSNALMVLTGVGTNVLSGYITGTTTSMQYSLNSTTGLDGTWTDCAAMLTPVTFVAGKVYVREKAHPTNTYLVATLSAAVAPTSGVTYNVAARTVTGLGATYEYSLNGGAWTAMTTYVNFVAGAVKVRTMATASTLPSETETIGTIAAAAVAPTSGVTYNVAAGTVDGLGATYEYNLNGGEWTTLATSVSFVAGAVKVRTKATASTLPSETETIGTIAAAAVAPTSGVTYNVAAGTVDGLGATYEYNLNGGAWATIATNVNFVAGAVKVRTKATASTLPSYAQTIGTIAAAADAPIASLDNTNSATATFRKSADGTGDTVAEADGYEFSLNGTTWNTIDGTAVDTIGNKTITVRVKASTTALASLATANIDTIALVIAEPSIVTSLNNTDGSRIIRLTAGLKTPAQLMNAIDSYNSAIETLEVFSFNGGEWVIMADDAPIGGSVKLKATADGGATTVEYEVYY